MGSVFSQADAQLAKYWFERRIYTFGPVTLPTGVTPVFSASNWTDPQRPEWQAALTGLWVTQNAGVQISWIYDEHQQGASTAQGFTDAAPSGVRRFSVFAPAVRQLVLSVTNSSGSPISNFQLNYEITLKRLTVAEKLLWGYSLTQADLHRISSLGQDALEQVKALVERGTSPIPIATEIERTLDNQTLGDADASGLWHATAGTGTQGIAFATVHVKPGEVAVIRSVAIEGAPAAVLYVDRDTDMGLLTLNGPAFVQANDAPWQPFLMALHSFQFRVAAQSTITVPVRLRITTHRLDNLWRVRTELAKAPQDVPGDTYAKVWAGIA